MKTQITDKDKGFKARARAIKFGLYGIKIGVQADGPGSAAHANSQGLSVIEVLTFHEFGLGVPRRSVVADWFDIHRDEGVAKMAGVAKRVAAGKITALQGANQIGLWGVGSMQERVSKGIPPPNAPSTIARKGSSVPMIDTGQTRSSITHSIVEPGKRPA